MRRAHTEGNVDETDDLGEIVLNTEDDEEEFKPKQIKMQSNDSIDDEFSQ